MTDEQEKTGTEPEIMKSPREDKNNGPCRSCSVSLSTGNKQQEAVIQLEKRNRKTPREQPKG